jgi:hypothetical protein
MKILPFFNGNNFIPVASQRIQVDHDCTVVYSDFHKLMRFTSKKMQNNILNHFCEKSFSIGEAISCEFAFYQFYQILICMYSMTPNFFSSFLPYDIRNTQKKFFAKTLLKVSRIEGEKLQFFTLFLAITFLLANFSHISQQFRNQHKILRCFDTHIQILQRKSFYFILALKL